MKEPTSTLLIEEAENECEDQKRKIPLENICQKRYAEVKKKYCLQFRKDIEEMASLQPNALAGVRIQRMFCVGLKIPKLENILTPSEKRKLEEILETS